MLIVLLAIIFGAIYFGIVSSQLKAEAATYDLSKLEQMESASVILDRNDKIFGQIYVENRETVPYDQLPRDLVNAVVAIEDNKFYQHGGYDLFGIVRAALKNFVAGHVRQGASTITQQLARNSFALKERTFRRKLLEIFVAERIEEHFGKQKIMELYLNRIYFGGGLYGAEAAARGYFEKPAREMSLAECATLAGIDQKSEPAFALDGPGGIARSAQCRAQRGCATSVSSTAQRCDRGASGRPPHRQPAKRAGADLRGRLHPAAGDRGGRMGPRDE